MHGMFEFYVRANREYREETSGIDFDAMLGADAARLAILAEEMKRQADALFTFAIGRVHSSGAWANGKARSAEEWVAQTAGTSWGEAKGRVELAEGLRGLSETKDALLEGRISGSQAALVARAAGADPHSESRLLDLASRASHTELRDASRRVVAAATGQVEDEQAAVHRTRFLRTWTGSDGAFNIQGRMTKADGAKVLAVLEPLMEVEFADARRQGRRETPDAYRADALVTMAERASTGGDAEDAGPSAHVVVRVDYTALRRGFVEGDEMCEIDHVGPVPVSEAHRLMSDAILTVLRTTGTVVTDASTDTRVLRKSVKRAVVERDRVCVVPTCGIAHGLEIDHLIPFAQGGPTSIDNLQRLCKHHHRLKTAGKAKLARWETPAGPQFGWLPLTEEGCEPVGHTDRTGDRTTERGVAVGGRTGAAGGEPERTLWTA